MPEPDVVDSHPDLADERAKRAAAIFLKLMGATTCVANRVFGQIPGLSSGGQLVVLEATGGYPVVC